MNSRLYVLVADAVAAFLVVFFLIAAPAFGAGGGWPYDQGNSLSGMISLSNNSYYSSSAYNYEDSCSASFWQRLDPQKVSFDNANWSFYVDSYDPTYWTITCYLHGLREDSEKWPQNQYWSDSASKGNVRIDESLSFSCQKYSWTEEPELTLGGTFNMSLSQITGSNFRYWEGEDTWYSWPDGYDHDPVLTNVSAWYAEYRVNGYLQSAVPEPSTLVLLAIFGAAIGIHSLRRRKKSD